MFKTARNQKTVTVKITRHELCDLCLACTVLAQDENREKWAALHDKLREILKEFDEHNPVE